MKITKTSWLILALGIFVITFASLGAARSQKLNEGQQISEELAMAEMRLSKLDLTELTAKQDGLQEQIKQAAQQRETAKATLSQRNDSITISDSVFSIARTSGVVVTQIGSSSLTRSKLDKLSCLSLPLTVSVQGEVPNLIDFIMSLNNDLLTGIVKSAQITIPKAADGTTDNVTGNVTTYDIVATFTDNTTGNLIGNVVGSVADKRLPSASIQIEVYTYQGS